MKIRAFLFIYILAVFTIKAEEPPAAISFMIADLKYSKKDGVKICEIQNGISSTFNGDGFLNPEYGIICPNFIAAMSEYEMTKWTIPHIFSSWQLKKLLPNTEGWELRKHFHSIVNDREFMKAAKKIPKDPTDISSYSAIVYVQKSRIDNPVEFRKQYPGVLVVDAPTYPYWQDKYKMSELFRTSILSSFKPKFILCQKKYKTSLANQIRLELPCDRYVIKPRGAFLGNGVIIVDGKDLDKTLQYILKKSKKLKKDTDRAYNYWYNDKSDSFVIEQFFSSDPISVPSFNNNVYQATMRVAFLMIYDKKKITIRYLGLYWQLPFVALDQKGSLNDKHKTNTKTPYFANADPKIVGEVYTELDKMLPKLYEQMIKG